MWETKWIWAWMRWTHSVERNTQQLSIAQLRVFPEVGTMPVRRSQQIIRGLNAVEAQVLYNECLSKIFTVIYLCVHVCVHRHMCAWMRTGVARGQMRSFGALRWDWIAGSYEMPDVCAGNQAHICERRANVSIHRARLRPFILLHVPRFDTRPKHLLPSFQTFSFWAFKTHTYINEYMYGKIEGWIK